MILILVYFETSYKEFPKKNIVQLKTVFVFSTFGPACLDYQKSSGLNYGLNSAQEKVNWQ